MPAPTPLGAPTPADASALLRPFARPADVTAIDATLVDHLLPRLTPTEWVLLVLIVRHRATTGRTVLSAVDLGTLAALSAYQVAEALAALCRPDRVRCGARPNPVLLVDHDGLRRGEEPRDEALRHPLSLELNPNLRLAPLPGR